MSAAGRSRRTWGWHRLDDDWAARVVAAAGVRPGELVLDIGAGEGALTAPLLRAGARVIAVELNPRRVHVLRRRFPGATVVHADATELRLPGRPFRVVASPPFSITAELLRLLLARDSKLTAADLVLQRAAVRKYLASDTVARRFSVAAGLALPRRAFRPQPRVDCAVLTVRRRAVRLNAMAVKTTNPETHTALVRRARRINQVLAETYPDAHCELDFQNPYQLLIATVLSAQTTDKRVNLTTPALFAKYPTPEDLAAANPEDVAEILKPTGFFRAKTKSVIGLSAALRDRFGGQVPRNLEDMVTLPGVGRKTANVVLGNAYGIPGITVDTHFGRLSRRFGWTSSDDPVKVEADVGALFPKSEWVMLSHRLIWHGRRICHARKPACGACTVADWCPSFGLGPTDAATAAKLVKTGPFS